MVVTVLAVWLRLHVTATHARRKSAEWAKVHGVGGNFVVDDKPRLRVPWLLFAIGVWPDQSCFVVETPSGEQREDYQSNVANLRRAFPEAYIVDLSMLNNE